MQDNDLLTTSQIAKEFEVSQHRVTYAIKTRGIEPVRVAGVTRLFGRDQLPHIKRAIYDALLNKVSVYDPQYKKIEEAAKTECSSG